MDDNFITLLHFFLNLNIVSWGFCGVQKFLSKKMDVKRMKKQQNAYFFPPSAVRLDKPQMKYPMIAPVTLVITSSSCE